jgi:hypothetical protein
MKFRHRSVEGFAPRIEYDGPLRAQLIQMQAHCLSQAPLDAIAHHGFANRTGNSKSDTGAAGFELADTKSGEQGTSASGTLIVNSSEVLRTQQTDTFRKTRDGELPLVADREFLAASRTAAGKDGAAVFGFHTGPEAVSLGTTTIIRLKGTFRHCGSIYQYSLGEAGLLLEWNRYLCTGQDLGTRRRPAWLHPCQAKGISALAAVRWM